MRTLNPQEQMHYPRNFYNLLINNQNHFLKKKKKKPKSRKNVFIFSILNNDFAIPINANNSNKSS